MDQQKLDEAVHRISEKIVQAIADEGNDGDAMNASVKAMTIGLATIHSASLGIEMDRNELARKANAIIGFIWGEPS